MAKRDYFNEARHLFVHGKFKESIGLFTRAFEEGDEPVMTLLSRGAAYMRTEDFDRAVADFSSALKLDPQNERALYYRGLAHLNKGDFEKAADDLNRAIALNPERGAAFLARGLSKSELGREDEAINDFKAAVAHSAVEVEEFSHLFGNTRTLFDRSMAVLEGERGPWSIVLTKEEIEKLKKWME